MWCAISLWRHCHSTAYFTSPPDAGLCVSGRVFPFKTKSRAAWVLLLDCLAVSLGTRQRRQHERQMYTVQWKEGLHVTYSKNTAPSKWTLCDTCRCVVSVKNTVKSSSRIYWLQTNMISFPNSGIETFFQSAHVPDLKVFIPLFLMQSLHNHQKGYYRVHIYF